MRVVMSPSNESAPGAMALIVTSASEKSVTKRLRYLHELIDLPMSISPDLSNFPSNLTEEIPEDGNAWGF